MLGHGILSLAGKGDQGRQGADEKDASIRTLVEGEVIQGQVGGVSDTLDIDIKGGGVGLAELAIDELGVFELHRLLRKNDAGIGNDNINGVMRADLGGRLEEADLGVPIGHITMLESKDSLGIGSSQLSNERLASLISDIANDNVSAVLGPVSDHVRAQAIGAARDDNGLIVEGGRVIRLAHIHRRGLLDSVANVSHLEIIVGVGDGDGSNVSVSVSDRNFGVGS